MAALIEDTKGSTRDLPIAGDLRKLLLRAADVAGVDAVRVISGGQCPIGTCNKRTGSQRHDSGRAADLQLVSGGERLRFTEPGGLAVFEEFTKACAAGGATGLGAGTGYMGPATIHVGYGTRAIWGAGGKSANAPEWLVAAVKSGWRGAYFSAVLGEDEDLDSGDEEQEEDQL